jgi:hypothetical protein
MTKLAQELTETRKKDFIKKERETLQGIINEHKK